MLLIFTGGARSDWPLSLLKFVSAVLFLRGVEPSPRPSLTWAAAIESLSAACLPSLGVCCSSLAAADVLKDDLHGAAGIEVDPAGGDVVSWSFMEG